MGQFIKGDVVVVPFPFSDLSSAKRRPALVMVALGGDDIILCQITSKNVKDDISVTIEVDDIEGGSLSDTSNIRPNKIFTADENIVLYKVGRLNGKKLKMAIDQVVKLFLSERMST